MLSSLHRHHSSMGASCEDGVPCAKFARVANLAWRSWFRHPDSTQAEQIAFGSLPDNKLTTLVYVGVRLKPTALVWKTGPLWGAFAQHAEGYNRSTLFPVEY
jgi:hypothetical protein